MVAGRAGSTSTGVITTRSSARSGPATAQRATRAHARDAAGSSVAVATTSAPTRPSRASSGLNATIGSPTPTAASRSR